MKRSVLRGIAVAVAFCAAAEPPIPTAKFVSIDSGITGGAVGQDGVLRFTPWDESMRFTLSPKVGNVDATFTALRLAAEAGVSIGIRFDPASGQFDPDSKRITHRLCGITYGAQLIGGDADFCKTPALGAPSAAERDIAIGSAEVATDMLAQGITSLDDGLASPKLPAPLKLIAFRARSGGHSALADELPHASPQADAEYALALADARSWETIAPDDHEAVFAEGSMLESLGGYDDALALYHDAAARWPDEFFRAQVRTGAIRRIRRDYVGALAALDEIPAHGLSTDGMKYHYHRGWTLILLGHNEVAIVEFSTGIEKQPDYAYAYLRRACTYGRSGAITEARSDEESGLSLLGRMSVGWGPIIAGDRALARDAEAKLAALPDTKMHTSTDIACNLSDADMLRPRSPLLPSRTT